MSLAISFAMWDLFKGHFTLTFYSMTKKVVGGKWYIKLMFVNNNYLVVLHVSNSHNRTDFTTELDILGFVLDLISFHSHI